MIRVYSNLLLVVLSALLGWVMALDLAFEMVRKALIALDECSDDETATGSSVCTAASSTCCFCCSD